jgi:hypothetical protein
MEQLTKKELAYYIPYGIPAILSRKGLLNQDDEYPNPKTRQIGIIKNISFFDTEINGELHIDDNYSFDFCEINEVTICLKPLSDLTDDEFKELLKLDIGHIDYISIEREYWIGKKGYENWLKQIPYGIIEKLLSWHYDIFNLIPRNLAIDINKIR